MKNKQQIEQEVEKTLDSLNGIERAVANPYLFTRIKARMQTEEKNFWGKSFAFISRPSVSIATIVVAIVINAAVFFGFRSESGQTAQEDEQVFASEYNLSDNTIYDATIDQ